MLDSTFLFVRYTFMQFPKCSIALSFIFEITLLNMHLYKGNVRVEMLVFQIFKK